MQDYIRALREERVKILVFERELPLCLQLVNQAIESCKRTTSECNLHNERTWSGAPVIIKGVSSNSDSACEQHRFKRKNGYNDDKNDENPDWLRSVQLCNQTAPSKANEIPDASTIKVGVKRDGCGGAFHPFKKQKNADIVPPAPTCSMARTTGGGGTGKKKDEQEGPSRKSRRCWSPQLHKIFLQALHQLGGSHAATPKQIRDMMKVDGLTNDEVKSHLQKYRLHTRRPGSSSQNISAATTQAPQFVVVTGGIWMPPEYTAARATPITSGEGGIAPNGIYAPIASLPPPFQETLASPIRRQHSNNKTPDSNVKGSHSPVTSSSTHTSTASLAY